MLGQIFDSKNFNIKSYKKLNFNIKLYIKNYQNPKIKDDIFKRTRAIFCERITFIFFIRVNRWFVLQKEIFSFMIFCLFLNSYLFLIKEMKIKLYIFLETKIN